MKKCVIIAGGTAPQGKMPLRYLAAADYLICADRGANYAFSLGYVPDLIVGDFDSIDAQVLAAYKAQGCLIDTYPVAKDFTDTELALQVALAKNPGEIALLAASGDRLDHTFANMLLLVNYWQAGTDIKIIGNDYQAWLCRDTTTVTGCPGDLVSLLAVTPLVEGITLQGFQYPLQNETLALGSSRGISNVLAAPSGSITLLSGLALVLYYPLDPA